MRIELPTLLTIVAMAAVTYLPRAAGVWLAGRFALSGRLRAWLGALPGAILVSMVVPVIISGGLAEGAAALATLAVAWRTRALLPSVIVGVGMVWLLRNVLAS